MEQIFRLQLMLTKKFVALTLGLFLVAFPGFAQTTSELDGYIARVRVVQDEVEKAYAFTGAMNEETVIKVVVAIDHAMGLLRDVTLRGAEGESALTEPEVGRIYEEVIFGERDNQSRGSLATLIYSSLIHHSFDPTHTYDGKVGVLENFKYAFLEVLNDLRAGFSIRKTKDGKFLYLPVDRLNREKVTRNMAVRLFDLFGYADKNEKIDDLLDYFATQLEKVATESRDLRRERLISENLALVFYASMMGLNLLHPQVLPMVPFDFVGWMTDGAWGSALVSGSILFAGYTTAVVTKYLTRTRKSYFMFRDLVRTLLDPASLVKANKTDSGFADELESQKAEQRALRQSIGNGLGPIGKHRARMINAGYDPERVGELKLSCRKAILGQLFR
ncbi:MAG: hypothetical protein IPJ71_06755 [Bdellovibrionales bacterium]|nr:hypothetical protein [Bdellovibrionales bacterium]